MGVVRLNQRQDFLFKFTANELNEARFTLVVDYPDLLQFWEMGMVKCDSDSLSVFLSFSIWVVVSNPIRNALYERFEFQYPIGSTV